MDMSLKWVKFLAILLTSAGNPIVFFFLLSADSRVAFTRMGGNVSRLSDTGILLLLVFGFLFLLLLAVIRKISGNETLSESIEIVASRLGPISVLGVTLPMLFRGGMEGNVFGFLFALPYVILSFVYAFFALHAAFARKK